MTDAVREALEAAIETMEAVADEIGGEFKHSARAGSLRTHCKWLREALTAAPGWRDISTAPKSTENKTVWVYGGIYEHPTRRTSCGDWWNIPESRGGLSDEERPTHWQPDYIPQPPEPKP